jgi:hypothetical protein
VRTFDAPFQAILLSDCVRTPGANALTQMTRKLTAWGGLFVYVRFMQHPDDWISGRFELDGRDIGSRTNFRKRP